MDAQTNCVPRRVPWDPSVPIGTHSPQGLATDSSGWWYYPGLDVGAPLWSASHGISLGLWAFVCSEDADENRLCHTSVSPAHGSPWGGFRTWCRRPCLAGGCSSQQHSRSSAGYSSSRGPEPGTATNHGSSKGRHGGKASAQALPPRAASARSDRNSTRAPSSVRFVSAAGQNEFYSPRFSFANAGIKHQERDHNQRPGAAATAISLFGACADCPLSFPLLATFHTWRILRARSLPTGAFHAPFVAAAGRDPPWFPNCFLTTHQPSVEVSSLRPSSELLGTALPSLVQP